VGSLGNGVNSVRAIGVLMSDSTSVVLSGDFVDAIAESLLGGEPLVSGVRT
jgi:hypothetical protein